MVLIGLLIGMDTADYRCSAGNLKNSIFLVTRSDEAQKNARLMAGLKRRIRLGDYQTATTFSD